MYTKYKRDYLRDLDSYYKSEIEYIQGRLSAGDLTVEEIELYKAELTTLKAK